MQKFIIEISSGNVVAVYSNHEAQIVLINRDEIATGSFPDCTPREPDFIFIDGTAKDLFLPAETKDDKNIYEQFQTINF